MTRQQALRTLQYAGYHDDSKTLVRIRCEERVSYENCLRAYREGQQQRVNGMRCGCSECRKLEEAFSRVNDEVR